MTALSSELPSSWSSLVRQGWLRDCCRSCALSDAFWPVPFLALLDLQGERLVHGLFVLVGLITYWVYPFHYPQLIDRYPLPITAFIIRNALVALLAVLLARRMHNPYETL
jgi:hypothetical protein